MLGGNDCRDSLTKKTAEGQVSDTAAKGDRR